MCFATESGMYSPTVVRQEDRGNFLVFNRSGSFSISLRTSITDSWKFSYYFFEVLDTPTPYSLGISLSYWSSLPY